MISFEPIGTVHSPFTTVENMPIQAAAAKGVAGRIVVDEKFAPGLRDLEGFSHIHIIYAFHRCDGYSLEVKPFLDDAVHGIFATRSPKRPCLIGFSTVRLVKVDGRELSIDGVDVMDGTPLLDIKPYVPEFDSVDGEVRAGWYDRKPKDLHSTRSDERFK